MVVTGKVALQWAWAWIVGHSQRDETGRVVVGAGSGGALQTLRASLNSSSALPMDQGKQRDERGWRWSRDRGMGDGSEKLRVSSWQAP